MFGPTHQQCDRPAPGKRQFKLSKKFRFTAESRIESQSGIYTKKWNALKPPETSQNYPLNTSKTPKKAIRSNISSTKFSPISKIKCYPNYIPFNNT